MPQTRRRSLHAGYLARARRGAVAVHLPVSPRNETPRGSGRRLYPQPPRYRFPTAGRAAETSATDRGRSEDDGSSHSRIVAVKPNAAIEWRRLAP